MLKAEALHAEDYVAAEEAKGANPLSAGQSISLGGGNTNAAPGDRKGCC